MKILQLPNIGNGGRLGNQLFTIASTIGLALRNGFTPRFPHWKYKPLFPNLPDEWFGEIDRNAAICKENGYSYDAAIDGFLKITGKDTVSIIASYLQSPKYWAGYEDKIRYYLKPAGVEPGSKKGAVAIHYRRGDYVGNPEYVSLPMSYYLASYDYFFNDKFILACSDDAAFVKMHHGQECYDEVLDFKTLCTASSHIISNSTFAWWAAYLGKHNQVVCPPLWFSGKLKHLSTYDLIPPHWMVNHVFTKAHAADFTFIIPVMYDHEDRRQNLQTVVNYIQQHFDANIIIGEINTDKFADLRTIRFDYNGHFHRTKALNEMTLMANTLFVINWDADVIIPPFQIYQMMQLLRDGADVVYPYDGTFAGVPRKYFAEVASNLETLAPLKGEHWRGFGQERFKSVGGALGYNVERFFKAGGENEAFVSYCPEDQERFWRFNLLGMDVQRIDGALYHLDHYRGPDSTMNNPDSREGHKYWERLKNCTKKELIKHLNLNWNE